MTKKKVINQNNEKIKEETNNKRKILFDVVLLSLITAPFLLLTLYGNIGTTSSRSTNQSLTNSWQKVSPAFSNVNSVPTVAPSSRTFAPNDAPHR